MHLAENSISKIIGIVPDLPSCQEYKLSVITQYTTGGALLKEKRKITSDFALCA
jgi:hypothetical protein